MPLASEQMRIANLMNDKADITELQYKVEKIIELTSATRDDAIVALHDCDNVLDRAIDMILEGESVNVAEWRSTGKKRKSKNAVVAPQQSQAPETEEKSNVNESSNTGDRKGPSNRGRGGPRLQRGGGGGGGGSGKQSNWKHKEEKSDVIISDHNNENMPLDESNVSNKNLPPRRGDSRRGRGRGSTRGNFSNRGTGGGRGARLFQNKGYRNITTTGVTPSADGFPNSIDTWTNSTADQASSNVATGDCTTMNVGNWSDFAGNEDWSEEDWDSSLMETKVFTPSTKALAEKEDIGDLSSNTVTSTTTQGLNFSNLLGKQSNESNSQQNQQSMGSILGSNVPRSTTTPSAGAALLQQLQQQAAASSQSSSQIDKFSLSQYTKQATENIKSLVGIPTTTYNSNNTSIMNSDGLDNRVSDLSQRQLESQGEHHQTGNLSSSKPPRLSSVKRPSKIPESAVEMPSNDSISSLNVQFGALPFDLGPEASNAFHDAVNHVKSKSNKGVTSGTSVSGSTSLSSAALLNAAVSDNAFRGATNNNNQTSSGVVKSSAGTASDLVLQNSVLGHQTISTDLGLDRNKSSSTSYGTKVMDGNHNKNSIYQSVATSQVQPSSTSDITSYKNASYQQNDPSNPYGSNVSYGTVTTAPPYVYSSSTNQTPGAYSTSNYSSFQPATTSHASVSGQKTMKDLDSTGNSQHKHYNDLSQGVPNDASGGSLGLVSNSTVTTNVLKNSLTATGKGIPNVPPGVAPPLLGTQYIMSQEGLSAFYPFYNVSIPAAHGRDHNFAYTANPDLKYSRADNDGSNVVSTQSPVSHTHNQAIFGQIPHAYSFFYSPGVNMMPQSLYGPGPFLPVPPGTNTGSTGSAFPKGTTGYGSHSYASAGYDSLAAVAPPSDYIKTNYGPSTGQQQVKGINAGNANDPSGSNGMYGKSHPQLNKSYDKPSFQTATPPPFNMAGAPQANTLGSTYAANPSQYIPMLPQTQPSMLHHTLQGDASQSGGAGVSGQRSISQAQKGSQPNPNKYYWNPIG